MRYFYNLNDKVQIFTTAFYTFLCESVRIEKSLEWYLLCLLRDKEVKKSQLAF